MALWLKASYDILEERKDNAKQLSDLLTAIELLKESPLDEGGAAGAYILKFVRQMIYIINKITATKHKNICLIL